MNDELHRYLAADKAEPSPAVRAREELVNILVYGQSNPPRDVVESVAARYFQSSLPPVPAPAIPPTFRGLTPRMSWIDEAQEFGPAEMVSWRDGEPVYARQRFGPNPGGHMDRLVTEAMARAVSTQRRKEFLCNVFGFTVEDAELVLDIFLPKARVSGRGSGKTARAERMRELNERFTTLTVPADFMFLAEAHGVLDDPEGRRLCELIYRRRNPMTEPVELINDDGEKSLALRFDGGEAAHRAMCRFLKGTHHTHHRAREYQKEHIVIHSGDKKLPAEAGDWVLTNEGWGFSVFTADEYDKLNERSD